VLRSGQRKKWGGFCKKGWSEGERYLAYNSMPRANLDASWHLAR